MIRFVARNFGKRPEHDGRYIVFAKFNKSYDSCTFTVEGGWNTHYDSDGELYTGSMISSTRMAGHYSYWLEPFTVGTNYWLDEIDTMIEEIKAELKQYDDRKLTEDEMEVCDHLEELYSLLDKAKDFAEEFK